MKIRHTVIFTFYPTTTQEQIDDVVDRLDVMGQYLVSELGVTDWFVAKHIAETFRDKHAHLLQDCVFPSLEALQNHGTSEAHKRVVELTTNVCDWMTVDTQVAE
jgi:Stress responsive A/B Barrel Domain